MTRLSSLSIEFNSMHLSVCTKKSCTLCVGIYATFCTVTAAKDDGGTHGPSQILQAGAASPHVTIRAAAEENGRV